MKQTRIQFILTLALAFLAAFVMAANAQDAKPEKEERRHRNHHAEQGSGDGDSRIAG